MFDFTGKRAVSLAATRAELGAKGHAAPGDLADGAQLARCIAEAEQALGGIDVLVNNASGFGMADTEEGWQAAPGVDVLATTRASRAA